MSKTHYFTSIASNYLPKARILARSLRKYDPDAIIHVVLCDVPPADFDLNQEPFDHLHLVRDLAIPNLMGWLFQHDLVEMCTAVKGPALCKIFEEYDAEQVFYFDPDIVVFHSLDGLKEQLAQASVVLTPHQVAPETQDEAVQHNELTSLKYGVYNLGFLGVRRTDGGLSFARWWRDRLLSYCFADIPNGLFTDQRWCDLAPALFDDVRILRDKPYNIATWNLTHREVTLSAEGTLTVDGKPLVFFHFSGFDSGGQFTMLKKYAPVDSPLFALHDWYVREMDKEGQQQLGQLPCIYSQYFNGTPIPPAHRRLYRARRELQERFPRPFDVDVAYELYDWMKLAAPPEGNRDPEPALAFGLDVEDPRATLTWRIGKLITGPVERAVNLVPGLGPAIKQKLNR